MRINKFPGLITEQDAYEFGLNGFVTADNVDISKTAKLSRREGYSSFYDGTINAAWGDGRTALFTEGLALKELNTDASATTLATLTATTPFLRACRAYDDLVFWSTEIDAGVIENGSNRFWGVLKPTSFELSETGGSLPEAGYGIGLAYVNARGQEGPMAYTYQELTGGLTVTIPHTLAELVAAGVDYVRLFLTTADGQILYRAGQIATGDSNYIEYTGDATDLTVPAESEHLNNMPTDGFICEHGGRLYTSTKSAQGGVVVFSEPYSELTNLHSNYFVFPDEVTGLGSVAGGLYIGTTEAVYFLPGDDPERMQANRRLTYGAIAGTMLETDGRVIGGEGVEARVILFASERGICMATSGRRGEGVVTNLTQRRVGNLTGDAGASIMRRANGQHHFITVLRS